MPMASAHASQIRLVLPGELLGVEDASSPEDLDSERWGEPGSTGRLSHNIAYTKKTR